jgi:predicted ATPase
VLTIVGPGGTGKTRFAIELARLLADHADGGTIFVPLAPVRDPTMVVPTVAQALGASDPSVESAAARVGASKTHLLLDNLEQLLPGSAADLAALVEAAPTLRLFVTSREALRVGAETQFELPPLADEEAVDLFVTRANAVRSGVERSAAVEELCRRLDRLPLALELAAARTKLLAPAALLDRLGQRLDLLKGGRDADPRHATLRATLAWSHDLLDPDEQALFARLSVFAAGATLESAELVCDADPDTLESLLDKSLLRRRTGALGEDRYWMLETIREYAAEQLAAADDEDRLRRLHAERMLEIARAAHLTEDSQSTWNLAAALAERADLRAALDRAEVSEPELALELAVALENFWNAHAPHEGCFRLGRLLEAVDVSPSLRARALRVYAGASEMAGERERGERLHEEALALARALADERAIASLTHRLAMSALARGDRERARVLADESQALAAGRFPYVEIPNHAVLGQVLVADGEVERGTEVVGRGAELARELGWGWWLAGQLGNLMFLALDRGDLEEAERTGLEALRLEWEQENRHWALYALTGLARVALARGEQEQAGLLWGAVEAESERARYGSWDAARAVVSGALATAAGPEFAVGRAHGRGLDLWDAAAVALDDDQTVP